MLVLKSAHQFIWRDQCVLQQVSPLFVSIFRLLRWSDTEAQRDNPVKCCGNIQSFKVTSPYKKIVQDAALEKLKQCSQEEALDEEHVTGRPLLDISLFGIPKRILRAIRRSSYGNTTIDNSQQYTETFWTTA